MPSIMGALAHAWNTFVADDSAKLKRRDEGWDPWFGGVATQRPDRARPRMAVTDKTILSAIYTRMAVDLSMLDFRHIRTDENGRYVSDIDSDLNDCLKLRTNTDQLAKAFIRDIAFSLFDNGSIAIVPVNTTADPNITGAYDILDMRVATIVQWYPQHVRIELYREDIGQRVQITVAKNTVAIVDNPFYSVMNEPSSTLQRLIRKLGILDTVDEASASGKLDILIQLPYVVKSDSKRKQAAQRQKDLEVQLKGSQYGIGYIDATEKVVQLNRPAENNMMAQIEYLVNLLYSQLGITPEIMNGSADANAMNNYLNRTIEPIADAIQQAMVSIFLTKTARTQNQDIQYFRNILKLIPIDKLGDIMDKLSRNEIVSSNEIRTGVLGLKPDTDPKSDQLVNSNMPQPNDPEAPPGEGAAPADGSEPPADPNTQMFQEMNDAITQAFQGLGVDENASSNSG